MQQRLINGGPIAQMNWGRMRYEPGDPRLATFEDSLDEVYKLAEQSLGFIWRIPDDHITAALLTCGFDQRTSATVSVWQTYADLRRYTFQSLHGQFLDRRNTWFEQVEGPQLVIWNVPPDARPSFQEALQRLEHLKTNGPSSHAFGWHD